MGERRGGPIGLGVVAIAAILFSVLPRTAPAPGKAGEPTGGAGSVPEKAEKSRPLEPLWKFLGCAEPDCTATLAASGFKIRFLVATVPDPVDSRFALDFDRAIEGIAAALSDAGFALDQWSLPWKKAKRADRSGLVLKPAEDLAGFVMEPAAPSPDAHTTTPGTFVFRDSGARQLLVLFVVGETPTTGLQKGAFTAALQSIEALEAKEDAARVLAYEKGAPLPLLGPYFSGSVESLRLMLAGQKTPRRFRIVSGSATSDNNRNDLRTPYGTFEPAVLYDYQLRSLLDNFLRDIGARPDEEVAILREELTGYGNQFLGRTDLIRGRVPVATQKFTIPFPLQISQLRSAYDKDETLRHAGSTSQVHRRALEISLEGGDSAKDALPPFDQHLTANAAEIALDTALDTIRRERIRFLGIVASDTRDTLFLARKARDAGIDAILFTFGADSLYVHPDVMPYLRGLLTVTPFPLVGSDQVWRPAAPIRSGRRSFSSGSQEGVYNAVMTLIGRADLCLDVDWPLAAPVERRAGDDAPAPSPLAWITVEGRTAAWPVRFARARDGSLDRARRRDVPLSIPASTVLLFLVVVASAAVLGDGCVRLRKPAEASLKPGRESFRSYFTPIGADSPWVVAGVSFSALCLVVLFANLACVVWLWKLVGIGARELQLAHSLLLIVSAVSALWLAYGALRSSIRVDPPAASPRSSAAQRAAAFVAFGPFLVALTLFLLDVLSLSRPRSLPLLFRSLNLGSGVGPLLPLALGTVAFALWAFQQLRRAVLYELQGFPPPAAPKPAASTASSEVADAYEDFMDTVRLPEKSLVPGAIALLSVVLFRLLFVGHLTTIYGFSTIDGKEFNLLLETLLLGSAFCLVQSLGMFLLLWIKLRRVLDALSRSRFADAFNRMPEAFAVSPWRMWRTPPTLLTLQVAVSHARTLASLGKTLRAKEAPAWLDGGKLDEVDTHSESAQKKLHETSERHVTLGVKKEIRDELLRVMLAVWAILEVAWGSWPPEDATVKAEKSGEEERSLNTIVWLRRQVPARSEIWVRIAEELFAVRAVTFIHYGFAQLRNVLSFTLAGFLLTLALIGSYPFQPRHPVVAFAWIFGVSGVAAVAWAFVDMERNTILSFIAKTRPGKVNVSLELLTHLAIYVALPLLTLLATQFPELGDSLLSVLDPAVRSVR